MRSLFCVTSLQVLRSVPEAPTVLPPSGRTPPPQLARVINVTVNPTLSPGNYLGGVASSADSVPTES